MPLLRRSISFASARYTERDTASAYSMTISKLGSSRTGSNDERWHVGIFFAVVGSSTYSMPYLQRISPQYASASSGKSAMMLSYMLNALSNSQSERNRFARVNNVSFFSLSSVGTVCLEPQYSHSQTVCPSATFRSPPHILHFKIAIG